MILGTSLDSTFSLSGLLPITENAILTILGRVHLKSICNMFGTSQASLWNSTISRNPHLIIKSLSLSYQTTNWLTLLDPPQLVIDWIDLTKEMVASLGRCQRTGRFSIAVPVEKKLPLIILMASSERLFFSLVKVQVKDLG